MYTINTSSQHHIGAHIRMHPATATATSSGKRDHSTMTTASVGIGASVPPPSCMHSGLGPASNPKTHVQRSWRSTGWKPLVYPSLALYDDDRQEPQQNRANARDYDQGRHELGCGKRLNPFFPLHKDVISATVRELLILDGALESSSLAVILPSDDGGDASASTSVEGCSLAKENDASDTHIDAECGKAPGRVSPSGKDTNGTNVELDSGKESEANDPMNANVRKEKEPQAQGQGQSTNRTRVRARTGNKHETEVSKKGKHKGKHQASRTVPRKRKRGTKIGPLSKVHPTGVCAGASTTKSRMNTPNTTPAITTNKFLERFIQLQRKEGTATNENDEGAMSGEQLSAEALVNKLRQKMIERKVSNASEEHSKDQSNRIRKVSDVDEDNGTHELVTSNTFVDVGGSMASTQSPFSAHLAVAAINGHGQTIDIESSVQKLLHDHSIDSKEFEKEQQQQQFRIDALLLEKYLQEELPPLLDLSIMVEAYLRQIALGMVKALVSGEGGEQCISEKALREFLGYKSPTAKSERVLELISDFLFDVSHAMFAWEKTEKDMYGNISEDYNAMQNIHDSTVCKTLFDNRALRKIGGFEPTSLLYHALSIKRLRMRGESWQKFAKTAGGKKMFSHHKDNLARVQAGAKRRDKRMKKNLAVCYPMNIHEERDKGRSRSSSLTSEESGMNATAYGAEEKFCLPETSQSAVISCASPTFPDIIPITISRQTGKSWGILLAREGSMCVVMRVPDGNETNLRRGDLIMSIRNECDDCVNTPTLNHSSDVSPEWFSEAVDIFKRSNTLHLDVRRVSSTV